MSSVLAGTQSRSSQSTLKETTSPFAYNGGRRYLREATAYPLPVDLTELNRQNLRTLLMLEVFGAPFCSKLGGPPKKVLEIACGTGLWSASCHEYFKRQGHDNISFTGLDLAPLAPDLQKQGVNWRFVQHDLRKPPMPFQPEEFDFIFVHDGMIVFAANPGFAPVNPLAILKRYVKPGGVVEIWEADFVFRCLLPSPMEAPGTTAEAVQQAQQTGTYTINAVTPFTKAQNKYVQDYNHWLEAAFQERGLSVAPCAVLGYGVSAEAAEEPNKVGIRRIAIPFSNFRWELETGPTKSDSSLQDGVSVLSAEQLAIRSTALQITIGQIEALEPLLREQSGMKLDEWHRWWSSMTTELFEREGTSNGECLEVIAAWVTR